MPTNPQIMQTGLR